MEESKPLNVLSPYLSQDRGSRLPPNITVINMPLQGRVDRCVGFDPLTSNFLTKEGSGAEIYSGWGPARKRAYVFGNEWVDPGLGSCLATVGAGLHQPRGVPAASSGRLASSSSCLLGQSSFLGQSSRKAD